MSNRRALLFSFFFSPFNVNKYLDGYFTLMTTMYLHKSMLVVHICAVNLHEGRSKNK